MDRTHRLVIGSLAPFALVGLTACSNSTNDSNPGQQPPATNALSFETGEFDVPAADSFTCFYTSTITDKELFVGNATAKQGPGGHHVTVYYTDTQRAPTHHTCTDAEMVAWHQISGAAGTGEPLTTIPEGGAIKVPAGKQIVVQSHYINTTGATETVNDQISIELVDAKDIKQFINLWVMNDASFLLQPNATGKSVTTCTVLQNLQTVTMFGHMHEWGKKYTLERVDAQGNSLEMVYQQDWQPQYASHPPFKTSTLDAPYPIKAGTILRQTCEWNNDTPDQIAFPREMCVAGAFYFEDQGMITCDAQPVMQP